MGVDLSEAIRCQPSDGWELYIKRMEASDFSKVQSNDTGPENPYFALYNKYTGVLRLFMYTGGNNTIGEDYFIVNTKIENGPGASSDVGLFLNDAGDYSYSLSEKSSNLNANRINVFQFEAVYKKWIVMDYVLSYDHTLSSYENIFLRVGIGAVDESEIQLEGNFDFEMNEVTRGKQNIISGLIDEVFGSSGKIKRRMNDVTGFRDNIEDIGNEFEDNSGILGDVGESLLLFASRIDPTIGTIGFVVGMADYVNAFTNIFGGGSTQSSITLGEGGMHLTGTVINDFPVTFHKFGLPLVQYTDENEEPALQEPIGLFSLKQKPEVTVLQKQFHYNCRNDIRENYSQYSSYGLYVQFDDQNMENLFRVNPESDMQFVDVRAVPFVDVRGPFLAFTYFPYYDVVHEEGLPARDYSPGLNIYSSGGGMHRFRPSFTLPHPGLFDDGYLIAGIHSEYFPEQVTTVDGTRCMGSLEPEGVSVYIRFYLKFENVNNDEIKAEFMRTFKADVTYENVHEL